MPPNMFKSDRLVFLPLEAENDAYDQILVDIGNSPYFPNSHSGIPKPRGSAGAKKLRERLATATICAFVVAISPASNTNPSDESDNAKDVPKPTPIGVLTLFNRAGNDYENWRHGAGELGVNLAEAYTGKGYGTEAVNWLLWYAFVMLDLHRMACVAMGWNKAARRMYERLGFKLEGLEREALFFMGTRHDLVRLGILRREWEERQKAEGKEVLGLEDLGSEAVSKIMGVI